MSIDSCDFKSFTRLVYCNLYIYILLFINYYIIIIYFKYCKFLGHDNPNLRLRTGKDKKETTKAIHTSFIITKQETKRRKMEP